MVEKLHKEKELDDRCLPMRISPSSELHKNSDEVDIKEEISVQTIDKQVGILIGIDKSSSLIE